MAPSIGTARTTGNVPWRDCAAARRWGGPGPVRRGGGRGIPEFPWRQPPPPPPTFRHRSTPSPTPTAFADRSARCADRHPPRGFAPREAGALHEAGWVPLSTAGTISTVTIKGSTLHGREWGPLQSTRPDGTRDRALTSRGRAGRQGYSCAGKGNPPFRVRLISFSYRDPSETVLAAGRYRSHIHW